MKEILEGVTTALRERRPCVYCAVVDTRGSTPQKPGAAMLVFPDGSQQGTLGGGCVEAEVRQKSLALLSEPAARPEVFSFFLDDDYGWDDGLICGGRMTILADPIVENVGNGLASRYYLAYRELLELGQGCMEAVVLEGDNGAKGGRYLFDGAGKLRAQSQANAVPEGLEAHLPSLESRPGPQALKGVAYLPILPRITLLLVGGGHVGKAVAQLAGDLDFNVWIVDDRETFASAERFPKAQRRLVGEIGPVLAELTAKNELGNSVYALVITRGHAHDEEALYHLAKAKLGYLGMIGSKRKIKLIFEDLIAKGIAPERLSLVHAPLGLDIGSKTVPEIAVSIVAELIACRNLGQSTPRPRVPIKPGNAVS